MFCYFNFPVRHEGIPKTACFVLAGREGRREGGKKGEGGFLVKQQFTVGQ